MGAATTSEPAIRTRGVSKRYGSSWAVRDLDLQVEVGEIFALLGPNGAGKTTVVEILQGFRARTGGEASVLGVDPARADAAWRTRVGVVPQSTGAFDDLSVAETLTHFAGFYPAPSPVGEVLEVVGLTEQRGRRCSVMSGGQKRRLDVALGVIGNPDLVFLDEPTTGLDPVGRRQTWDLVRALAERGRTVVLTTHYLDEAEALADRAGIIVRGILAGVGTVTELVAMDGRSTRPTGVRFQRTGALCGAPLPLLPAGTTVDLDEVRPGGTVQLSTTAPSASLAALLAWAAAAAVPELAGLDVRAPTLEDAYLALVGDGTQPGTADPDPEQDAA